MVATAIQSFTGLRAWQEAHALVLTIYRLAKLFPKEEMFGLTQQIQRAAVSISSNIAEGFSRQSPREKTQFYYVSLASLTEVQNQLLIARDVGHMTPASFNEAAKQTVTVSKLINGLIKSIKSRTP